MPGVYIEKASFYESFLGNVFPKATDKDKLIAAIAHILYKLIVRTIWREDPLE